MSDKPYSLGSDPFKAADQWAHDCDAAAQCAFARYKDKSPQQCPDLSSMERIAVCMAAGVPVEYSLDGCKLIVKTKRKCGIEWDGKKFCVTVLLENKCSAMLS